MNNQITWVITEIQNGQENEVWETYSIKHAYALMQDYCQDDLDQLNPCIYKRLPNGDLTTEY